MFINNCSCDDTDDICDQCLVALVDEAMAEVTPTATPSPVVTNQVATTPSYAQHAVAMQELREWAQLARNPLIVNLLQPITEEPLLSPIYNASNQQQTQQLIANELPGVGPVLLSPVWQPPQQAPQQSLITNDDQGEQPLLSPTWK